MAATSSPDTPLPHLWGEGLSCRRGGRLLFNNLDIRVGPGELLQVAGPNGCGKTSLLRILCGLRMPDEGVVRWAGSDIRELEDEYRSEMVFIGYQSGIKADLSPRENLQYIAAIASDRHGDIEEALEKAGLAPWSDTPCRQLSAGQNRRAALARLMLLKSRIWILDEPLTGLDQKARITLEATMFQHATRGGIVVFTTHHPVEGNHAGLRLLELGS